MISPYYMANRGGIARIASTGVTATTTDVTIHFTNHGNLKSAYRGLVIVKMTVPIPTGTTQTLPVKFDSGPGTQAVAPVKLGNQPITVADMPGVGVYIFYYDNVEGVIEQVSGTI